MVLVMSETYTSPKYVPRPKLHVRRSIEAEAYALRVRDGTGNLFDTSAENCENLSPVKRLPSAEAKKNYAQNKGCIKDLMGGYADPVMTRPLHPRAVRQEAAAVAENNKGGSIKNLIENYGNLDISDHPRYRVKGGNAEYYAERNNGNMNVINGDGGLSPVNCPVHRREGGKMALKNGGSDMGPILRMEGNQTPRGIKLGKLHQESQTPSWDELPPPHRVRPEAEEIFARHSNSAMADIMKQNQPMVFKGRCTKTPEENKRLRTSPMRTKPEAMKYYNKNKHSEMGAIMRGEPLEICCSPKVNKNFVRSEEW